MPIHSASDASGGFSKNACLSQELITALWSIPVVLVAVWFSRPEYSFPFFTVVAAIAGLLGAYEFYKITGV